jgi:hypothetical protein
MATLEVYPDPNVESTSVDGVSMYEGTGSATWATVRDAVTGTSATDTDIGNGQVEVGASYISATADYRVYRSFYLFDTSSLDDAATISAAVLSLNSVQASENADSGDVDIIATTPASNTAITTADYDQIGATVFASIAVASISPTNGTYNDFTLDANGRAGVSKTGISKYGARHSRDTDNSAPTGRNETFFWFADNTGTSKDPKLVVTYTVITPSSMFMLF